MYIDPRTVGLWRLVVGLLLCADCIRRWVEAERYYSNAGVLTNHWNLFRPSNEYNFSIFHAFSSPEEVHIAFALAGMCYFMLAIGWRSRLFSVLSCVWASSMDHRMLLAENGGYIVVNLTVFWLMFLPSGQRFSVDSLLRSWRERREGSLEQLADRYAPRWLTNPRHSLIALIVVLNFGLIYVFNVVNKYGATWRAGDTLHFVLHLDRMVTGLAVMLRETLPYWSTWILTHLVLVIEAVIVVCVFWPQNRRRTRPVAMLLVLLLHVSLGVLMRLGPFSWFMIAWSLVLLMPVHWEMATDWYRRTGKPVQLCFDTSSGLGWWLCRLLSRLDRTQLITFVAKDGGRGLLAVQIDAEVRHGSAAWWSALRALPAGRFIAPVARGLSLGLLDALFTLIDRNARTISRWFGLSAPPRSQSAAVDAPSAARVWLGRGARGLRELTLAFLMLGVASQLINENKSVPEPLKHEQPAIVRMSIQYPRTFQGWGMFAPNPIREDGIVTVDAITIDGRHVDPFSGKPPDMNLSDARGLGLSQIQQDYFNRIRLDRNKQYRKPMGEWIRRHHRRTGNPSDEIVFYNVWWLTDRCPERGSTEPTDHEMICIASWRKPRHRVPKGQSPLPRRCDVASAN